MNYSGSCNWTFMLFFASCDCYIMCDHYPLTYIFPSASNLCFDSNSYIDNDWQWVGTGYEGKTTKLNYIEEYAEGPINKLYLGIIFDDSTQIGFAAHTIEVAISATPAIPPAIFEPDFDKTEALRYAKLSQLAYQPYSEVQRELANYNLTAEMQIYDSTTDTNGFIASDATSVVVAFRGTKSFTNKLTDAKFLRKRIVPDGQSFAHRGFVTALNAVYPSIKDKLQPYIGKKELYITGHSLGGALATLMTYLISRNFSNSQPKQYVYGCPPVGDINLANYFKGMDSNTITIQNDPISSGALISGGAWAGLYKPVIVKFLPKAAGHGIADYIEQLENLQEE